MSNELVVIENVELVPFFTKGDKLDDTLKAIEAEALAFVPGDLSVKKNRDAVKAMVTKVTRSKTYLESNGKDLAAEYKLIPKMIDANRKKTKDFLTELQAKVRQPLTDWEEEQKRIAEEKAEQERLQKIADEIAFMWEFAWAENEAFDKKREEERLAEIERQRLHDEEISRVAANNARVIAEAEAKSKIEAAEREKREAEEREEAQRQSAIRAEFEAEQAEIRRVEREKQIERDRVEAEKRAKREAEEAAARAKQAEIERQRQEELRIAEEKAQRESNRAHVGKVRKQAKESLIAAAGITEEQAKAIALAMSKGEIANC